jgi:hemoglobin
MHKHFNKIAAVFTLAAALAVPSLSLAADKTLYERLGGKKAITKVVDEFVNRIEKDARINHYFAQTEADAERMKKFKLNLIYQICQATGGPFRYTGKNMKDAHAGMGITSADFNALIEDLSGALDKFKVQDKEKNELLGALAPMKADIVTK